jgi:chromosomal replication initiation ATPase DnaA
MKPTHQVIASLSARGLLGLVSILCAHRGITLHELCGAGRTKAVSAARHEVWWNLRWYPGHHYSYFEIARLFGCDHSSVRYGVLAHVQRSSADPF